MSGLHRKCTNGTSQRGHKIHEDVLSATSQSKGQEDDWSPQLTNGSAFPSQMGQWRTSHVVTNWRDRRHLHSGCDFGHVSTRALEIATGSLQKGHSSLLGPSIVELPELQVKVTSRSVSSAVPTSSYTRLAIDEVSAEA
mmetsp:Transcript_29164/g.47105  ORF Transcript_29164/g.47105 Transcript_29164/m.47105 type:complete len:139 (+) Transcript_29164:107-523(+)